MIIRIIMKHTNYKFSGKLINETETHWIINDIKLGKTEILKSEVAVKSVVEQ